MVQSKSFYNQVEEPGTARMKEEEGGGGGGEGGGGRQEASARKGSQKLGPQ